MIYGHAARIFFCLAAVTSHLSLATVISAKLSEEGPTQVHPMLRRDDVGGKNQMERNLAEGTSAGIGKVLSLPLTPHHVLKERLRRELGVENQEEDVDVDVDADQDRRPLPDFGVQQIGALYQGYGTHYFDIWVGTPSQRQTVIVATAARYTAFPCSGCGPDYCGREHHTDPYFNEEDSSTFHEPTCDECLFGHCSPSYLDKDGNQYCRLFLSYAEGSSWTAHEARDVAYALGPHHEPLERTEEDGEVKKGYDPTHASKFSFVMNFGCQNELTGLFKTQLADGILGMENSPFTFWKQMLDAGVIAEAKFSLCFNRQPIVDRDGNEAGVLTLGGVDARLHNSPMVYAQNVRNSGFFTVRLKRVYLRENGGESAKPDKDEQKATPVPVDETTLNKGGVFVDSGTTDTYLPYELGAPFRQLWYKMTGRVYGHTPMELTEEELRSLPTVLFQLSSAPDIDVDDPDTVTGLAGSLDPSSPDDVIVAFPATHYMEYNPSMNKYIPRIYFENGFGSTLGANVMMGHDISFEVDNGRIGFAESDCDYNLLLRSGEDIMYDTEIEDEGAG